MGMAEPEISQAVTCLGKVMTKSMFIPILQHLMPIVGIWHLQDARMKTWSMQV